MLCKSLLLAWPATLLVAGPALARAADEEEAAIVVEGSRIAMPAATITASPPPETALPPTALDLLETLPDVRAASTGGAGGNSFVSIRGAEPNFAQILIDGVRVSNPSSSQGGGFDFAQFDPALIAGITIVPGSQSAVYGSDALSGVIAIRLAAPVRGKTSVGGAITRDSETDHSAIVRLNWGWDDGGVLIAVSDTGVGELEQGSTLDQRQALLRIGQDVGRWSLSGFALVGNTEREGFPESSGGPRLAANRALERRDTRFVVTGMTLRAPEADAVRPSVQIGYYDDNVRADTPAIFPGVFDAVPALTSDTDYDRLQIAGDIRFRVSERFDLLVGTDFQHERAASTGTIDFGFLIPTAFTIARKQLSGFAEAVWRPTEDLKLAAATRTDWLRDRAETTAQASVEYRPGSGDWALFAGYGEGFRLPSLFALAFPLTANPDLRPERSESWEAGVRWQRGATNIRASLFLSDYTDLIDFDPDLFATVNRAATTIRGASVSGQGRIGARVDWNGSFTVLDFEAEVPLRSRPDRFGHLRLAWRAMDTLRLGGAATFNSDALETSVPTGIVTLDGQVTFDLFAEWQARERLTLALALRNAADTARANAIGFPEPGPVLRARIGYAF